MDEGHDVDVEVVLPCLERLGRLARRVVHVDVEATEGLDRRGDEATQRLAVGGICGSAEHRAPAGAELGNGLVDLLRVAGTERDRSAFGQQEFDDGPADTLGRPRDKCFLSGKSEVHGTAPLMSK